MGNTSDYSESLIVEYGGQSNLPMLIDINTITPTVSDFQNVDWQNLLAKSSSKTCDAYRTLFHSKANEAVSLGNVAEQNVYMLLSLICDLHMKPDTPNAPFVPMSWGSVNVGDFTNSQLDTLKQILNDIQDAELKARVADIVWLRKLGNYQTAQIAVDAYLQSAQALEDPINWVPCADRIERALYIALSLGRTNPAVTKTVKLIETLFDKYEDEDSSFLPHHLMEFLLYAKEGETSKYIGLSEKIAKSAESSTNSHKWHYARSYWTISAEWYNRAKDETGRQKALICAAETYVKEAEDASSMSPMGYSLAVSHIQHAIEAYRKIPGTETRREELQKELLEYQKQSVSDLRPFSYEIDVSEMADKAIALVKGKSMQDALVSLAFCYRSPDTTKLRSRIEELMKKRGLYFSIPVYVLGGDGKLSDKRSGIDGINDESVLRDEMFREAAHEQELFAEAIVRPALIQIDIEHYIRESDLWPIVSNNPFVPPGREIFFARGLYAGLTGDLLVASHLLLPQIENSLRYVLQHSGHIVSGIDQDLIQDEYTLNKILYERKNELTALMGADLVFDLQGLLIERFGSNFRNLVSHGLMEINQVTSSRALYLWWLTLRLCCVPVCERVQGDVTKEYVNES